jgi:uncharacterized membrane protein YgdD (TMEM256/DUF423 family)
MLTDIQQRIFGVFAGLFGFSGIALAAAATHLDDQRLLGGASLMCLVHAPALFALSLAHDRLRLAPFVGLMMVVGTCLFAGDLLKRHYTGAGLFPMSAPTGGFVMMGAWLLAGIGSLLPVKRS